MKRISLLTLAFSLVALLGLGGPAFAASVGGTADVEVLDVIGITDPQGTPISDLPPLDFGEVTQPGDLVSVDITIDADNSGNTAYASGGTTSLFVTGSGGAAAGFSTTGTAGKTVSISTTTPTCTVAGLSLSVATSTSSATIGDDVFVGGTLTVDGGDSAGGVAGAPTGVHTGACTFTVSADY